MAAVEVLRDYTAYYQGRIVPLKAGEIHNGDIAPFLIDNTPAGTVRDLDDPSQAPAVDVSALRVEREKCLARVAEIDVILEAEAAPPAPAPEAPSEPVVPAPVVEEPAAPVEPPAQVVDDGPAVVDPEVTQDPAGDSADDPALDGFDPAEHPAREVLGFVEAHPESKAAVRAAELAGKARTTLLAQLA